MIQYSLNQRNQIFKKYYTLLPYFDKARIWYFQINYKFLKIKSICLIFLFLFFSQPINCNFMWTTILTPPALLFFYFPFFKFLNYN